MDVTVQMQIIELLKRLQKEMDLSILLISHDLALVQHLCDRVIVMYQGNIVEQGRTERVINAPENGYTKMLIEAAMLGQEADYGFCCRVEENNIPLGGL